MSRKDYFSDNLIHMRDQLKKYQKPDPSTLTLVENSEVSPENSSASEPQPVVTENIPPTVNIPSVEAIPEQHGKSSHHHKHDDGDYDLDHKKIKSLKKRHEELILSRRDLLHRLAETSGVLAEEQNHYEVLQDETAQFLQLCKQMSSEIKAMPAGDDLVNDSDAAALGSAFRKIEHSRLEFIREHARYKKLISHDNHSQASGHDERHHGGILPEISSMSFLQLVRLGLILTLPAIVAFIGGALLIAVAIILSMGGFNQG